MRYYVIERPNALSPRPSVIGPFEDSAAAVRDSATLGGKYWQRWRMVLSEEELRTLQSRIDSKLSEVQHA